LPPTSMNDFEGMLMGTPMTVGEISAFLAAACKAPSAIQGNDAEPNGDSANVTNSGDVDDMFDWSLARWRQHCMETHGRECDLPAFHNPIDPTAHLFVEERPFPGGGSVLVHRVPFAPPRPILCIDDPEASMLTTLELLFAYPELDALPIVDPTQNIVVGHLTFTYCLSQALNSLSGSDLMPLAEVPVKLGETGVSQQRVFSSVVSVEEEHLEHHNKSLWVLKQTQPLSELLAFFTSTSFSTVPVVEDDGCVLGLLTRRHLIDFLDLSMQSANKGLEDDSICFDAEAPIKVVLEALQRFLPPQKEKMNECKGGVGTGASFVYGGELSLKNALLRVLAAANNKLLFVEDPASHPGKNEAPQLLGLVSAGDIWQLLINKNPGLLKGDA